MTTLFEWKTFYKTKATELLPLQCEGCGKTFRIVKRRIQAAMAERSSDKCKYCTQSCAASSRSKKIELLCGYCQVSFTINKGSVKPTKTGEHFCSKRCLGKFIHKEKLHATS